MHLKFCVLISGNTFKIHYANVVSDSDYPLSHLEMSGNILKTGCMLEETAILSERTRLPPVAYIM